MKRGSLTAIGIGIRAPSQTTLEASLRIERADKVFSLVADPLAEHWLSTINENVEPLHCLYVVGKERRETYAEIVARVLEAVREGLAVCAVTYGHPGIASFPLHESIRQARAVGFTAEMLAAVSAEDCLFSDLGIDPVSTGFTSYEATDFLVRRRSVDITNVLLLWQVGVIGELSCKTDHASWNPKGLEVLTETLLEAYPADHEVVIYEAARLPLCTPYIVRTALRRLPEAGVTALCSLLVPPVTKAKIDQAMVRRLDIQHLGVNRSHV
jgi:uncharacterized protein YabN with tetrapyrrole methylase and pyrophosphatase domain